MFTTLQVPALQIPPSMGISHAWNHKCPAVHLYLIWTPTDEQHYRPGTLLPRHFPTMETSQPCLGDLLSHHTQILSSRELLSTRGRCLGAEVPLRQQDPTNPCLSKGTAPAWGLCQPFSPFSSQELFHSTCRVTPKICSGFVLIFCHLGQCRLIVFSETFRFPSLGIQETFEGNEVGRYCFFWNCY